MLPSDHQISDVAAFYDVIRTSAQALSERGIDTSAYPEKRDLVEKAQMLCPFDMHLAALVYQVSAVAVLACSHRAVAALC